MLVMHIGPHKTATTYIQHNFFEAHDLLKDQGWIYPELGAEGLSGHHDLAHNALRYISRTGDRAEALQKETSEAAELGQNLVFSAEGFCRWGKPKFDGFLEITGAETLDLVYVIRDPLDVFYSYWAEEVKQGYSASLPERFSENFNNPSGSRLLNPMQDLKKVKRFENVRLHTVPFETLRSQKIDIFEHICSAVMGLEGITASSARPKNTSFPIELTEFLRMLTLMQGQGVRRLEDGSAMRLRFTAMVSQEERDGIVDLIRRTASDAKREISFPEDVFYKRRLARLLCKGLEECWTLPISEEELFRFDQKKSYIHYNSYALMQHTEIREAGQEILARIAI